MPKLDITSQQRSALRATAHPLRPVVLIGDRGLTEAVLKEIDLNLNAHQLIKVRIAGDDREARIAMMESICDTLSCALVNHLGKTLILYRHHESAERARTEAERARIEAENTTRAVRKPSEPHTPKKQAAQGVTRNRKAEKASRAARLAEKSPSPGAAAPRARRASAAAERPAHGIPRRAGSAMSLRAGARRGLRSAKR